MAIINPNGSLPVDILSGAGSIDIDAWQYEKTSSINALVPYLFRNNEVGFAYDPNDLTTLYQDAAGTTPVTAAGQPVGLVLDKSGRGNHAYQATSSYRPLLKQIPILSSVELVKNGTFDTDVSGWTSLLVTATSESSKLKLVVNNTGGRLSQAISTVVGTTYRLYCDATAISGMLKLSVGLSSGSSELLNINNATSINGYYYFTATATTTYINLSCVSVGNSAYFDNVSVKAITGYITGKNYIQYDGIDDKLTTTLSAQLTGCTVVRSVPNVGTQILTGQTIPATYNDNTDHCGLIVINRALTPSETSAITAEFNKRAGV